MGGGESRETEKNMPENSTGANVASSLSMSMSLLHKGIATKFASVHHINTQTLQKMIDNRQDTEHSENQLSESSQLIILDVRPEEEFIISHIQGAVRVGMDTAEDEELLKKFVDENEIATKDSTIVCYCSVGYRSSFMADKLQNLFKENTTDSSESAKNISVFNLEGSLFQWANEHRAMIDSQGNSTVYAHPYNTLFGKLLDYKLRQWPKSESSSSAQ